MWGSSYVKLVCIRISEPSWYLTHILTVYLVSYLSCPLRRWGTAGLHPLYRRRLLSLPGPLFPHRLNNSRSFNLASWVLFFCLLNHFGSLFGTFPASPHLLLNKGPQTEHMPWLRACLLSNSLSQDNVSHGTLHFYGGSLPLRAS